MSSTLKRPPVNHPNKRPLGTYFALVLLVAAGAGVVVRYQSKSQQPRRGSQVVFPIDSSGSIHIAAGQRQQGPFEINIGSAMSTPTGFWPTLFLRIRYPESDHSPNSLAHLHRDLRAASAQDGPDLRVRTANVIDNYLSATVQPLDINGAPCGLPAHLSFNSFFGPDSPLAGALPTSYSAQTRHVALDVVENAHPGNHARWVISGLFQSVRYIQSNERAKTTAQWGPVRLEGEAYELPDTHASDAERARLHDPDGVHLVSGVPALECVLRTKVDSGPIDDWRLVVDRMLPQYIVPTPRMREDIHDPISLMGYSHIYPITEQTKGGDVPACALYCCAGYPGQQQLILIGGRMVRQETTRKTLTFHNLDLVYNPTLHVYEGTWETPQKAGTSDILIYALNGVARSTIQTTAPTDYDTAVIRFAYRFPSDMGDRSAMMPENFPGALLVDPFNATPPPTSMLRFPPPVITEDTDMMGIRFDNWFGVYLPGAPPAGAVDPTRRDFAAGIRDLIRKHSRGALLRLQLPPKLAAAHKTIHLNDVKVQVLERKVIERHPFTFTLPVSQRGEDVWNKLLTPATPSVATSTVASAKSR